MSDYVRGTSNPNGEVSQHNSYGLNDHEIPAPEGRSYDSHQRSSADHTAVQGGGNVTHARDPQGNPVPADSFTDDTIVTIAGVGTMSYLSARQAGFITARPQPAAAPNAPEVASNQPETPEETSEVPETGTEETLTGTHAAAEETITRFAEAADDSTKLELVDAAATGDIPDDIMARAGDIVGSPEAAQAVRGALEDQALEAIGKATGLSGDALREFAASLYETHPDEMASAIKAHMTERSTAGYRRLASQVAMASTEWDGDPQIGEGVKAFKGPNGSVWVNVNGQDLALSDAVALGWVTVSRRINA